MKKLYVFDITLPNNGWENLYSVNVERVLKTHQDPYEIRRYMLSDKEHMTIGVMTMDSVYKSIKQSITTNIGIEVVEVTE